MMAGEGVGCAWRRVDFHVMITIVMIWVGGKRKSMLVIDR
jgi:hypothetical protein